VCECVSVWGGGGARGAKTAPDAHISTVRIHVCLLRLCRWLGTDFLSGMTPFHTAGVQLILFRSDIVPYGHSNVRVLNNSIAGVINVTITCLVTVGNDEFSWNTTIVQPRKFLFNN
jgi:hypothetical protein